MDHESPNSAASHLGSNSPGSRATDARRLMLGVVAGIVAGLALVAALAGVRGLLKADLDAPLPSAVTARSGSTGPAEQS